MEIGKFNEHMKKFTLLDEIPNKEIGLITIIESLLDMMDKKGKAKMRKIGCFIIPPWLYDIKDSSIILHFGDDTEVNVNKDLIEAIKNDKPYIRISEEKNGFTVDIPVKEELQKIEKPNSGLPISMRNRFI